MGRRVGQLVAVAACALTGMLVPAGAAQAAALVPVTETAATNDQAPIHITAPANDPRVFVVQRGGDVRIVRDGVLDPSPFLSVPEVDMDGERGLLSIAFAPDYVTSGLVYVFAVVNDEIRVMEYATGADPDVARFVRTILTQAVVATNHIGGQLVFGPDGKLYITIGDNAVPARAQQTDNRFGKVLRLDPRGQTMVPADNPFGNEVWALGLRNPYRAAFAPDGKLIIGDVGDSGPDTREELNLGVAGANFGWPTCEGPCSPANTALTDPAHAYPNPASGCAVIAGLVVRDPDLTGLTGRYLFGDLCQSPLRTLDLASPATSQNEPSLPFANRYQLYGFGEDGFACAYVLADRRVFRVAASALAGAACPRAVGQPIPGIPAVENPDPIRPSGPGAGLPPAVVTPPPPPPSGAGPVIPSPDLPAAAIPSRLTVVSTSLRIDKRGRVGLRVRCRGTNRCSGRLRVTSASKVRRPGSRRAQTITLAGATLTRLPAGTRTLRLTVRRADRRLIARRAGKRLRVRVRVVTSRPGQASQPVSSRVLSLRAPR